MFGVADAAGAGAGLPAEAAAGVPAGLQLGAGPVARRARAGRAASARAARVRATALARLLRTRRYTGHSAHRIHYYRPGATGLRLAAAGVQAATRAFLPSQ